MGGTKTGAAAGEWNGTGIGWKTGTNVDAEPDSCGDNGGRKGEAAGLSEARESGDADGANDWAVALNEVGDAWPPAAKGLASALSDGTRSIVGAVSASSSSKGDAGALSAAVSANATLRGASGGARCLCDQFRMALDDAPLPALI